MLNYKLYLKEGDKAITKSTASRFNISIEDDRSQSPEMVRTGSRNNVEQPMEVNDEMDVAPNPSLNIAEETVNHNLNENTSDTFNDYLQDILHDINVKENDNFYMKPRSLEEFVQSKTFSDPITARVNKTRGEIFLMILKFSIINNLSITGMTNLFALINTLFEIPILPDSRYLTDKLLNPKTEVQFHGLCMNCSEYLGQHGEAESPKFCNVCRTKVDLRNPSSENFFVLINPERQIADLLQTYQDHYDYVTKERNPSNNALEDVYDGKMYRKFIASLPEEDQYNYVTATFNTDGAPKFKSSKRSIWPLYLMIHELPKQDRMKKLICCGLWFGKKKPDMIVFLDKFVDLTNSLKEKGIPCIIKNEKRLIRLHILTCCVDSVARAPIQGIKQFNGYFGCNWCLHPGEYDGTMLYTLPAKTVKMRNHADTVRIMMQDDITNDVGIKHFSPLVRNTSFDIIEGFVPDYMHCCLEGVAAQMMYYYMEPLGPDKVKELDFQMNNILAPRQVQRLTRAISSRDDWKAREWENFTLYYSAPLLSSILSRKQFEHWLLFVNSLYIMLQNKITINELDKADKMLHKFVGEVQELYGKRAMTYNVHLLLHIGKSVLNWGPLFLNSTFCFESANRYILDAIKCSRGATQQIVRFVNINHSLQVIEQLVTHKAHDDVIKYCEDILAAKVFNVYRGSKTLYFGKGSYTNENLLNTFNLSENSLYFLKVVKEGCLYESYSRTKTRSNNSFAILKNGTFISIAGFIVDEEQQLELTTFYEVNTNEAYPHSYRALKVIEYIDTELKVTPTENIHRICVYINVRGIMYLCPLPNLLHY